MKKLSLLSIIFVFFAGFSFLANTSFAQSLPPGTSTDSCRKVSVKQEINDNGKRVWEECTDNNELGCQLRFCNSTPTAGSGANSSNFWAQKECNKYCVGFQEAIPIGGNNVKSISGNSGTDLMLNYVSMIYKFGAIILSLIAVLVIVVSGVQMITGGAEESNYTDAKDRILQAILSLVMLFSSALILKTINPDFFHNNSIDPASASIIQMEISEDKNIA